MTVRSKSLVLHTDARAAIYKPIVARLEEAHAALVASFFRGVETRGIEVLVFESEQDYQAAMGSSAGAFVSGVGRHGKLLVVKNSMDPDWLEEVAAHELAHELIDRVYPTLPGWLDEGLATYLQTVRVGSDRIELGGLPEEELLHYRFGENASLDALLGAGSQDLYGPTGGAYYAAAWGLVHYLLNAQRSPERFGRWIDLVARAEGRQAIRDTLAEAYPERTLEEIEAGATTHANRQLRARVETVFELSYKPPPQPPFTVEPADRPHLRTMLATLNQRRRAADATTAAVVDLQTAIATRPHYVHLDMGTSGYFGLAVARNLLSRVALELNLGRWDLGYQTALLARLQKGFGGDQDFFFTFGYGPALAFKSEALGSDVERTPDQTVNTTDVFFHVAMNVDVGVELRTAAGLMLSAGVGVYVRLAENMSRLCKEARENIRSPCFPADGDSAPYLATVPAIPYLRAGLGWAW